MKINLRQKKISKIFLTSFKKNSFEGKFLGVGSFCVGGGGSGDRYLGQGRLKKKCYSKHFLRSSGGGGNPCP